MSDQNPALEPEREADAFALPPLCGNHDPIATNPPPAAPADGRGDCGTPLPAPPVQCRSARPARRTSAAAFFEDEPDPDDPLLGFAPYLHAAPRRNSITPDRQRAFIAALAASGVVTQAARSIGASVEALYTLRHRKGAERFSEAWDHALDRGMQRLEDCALERALRGEERPVVSQGKVVATYVHYDTALILFLLRHRRSVRYAPASGRDPLPGSPLYQRIIADYRSRQPSSEEIIERINAKIETIKQRRLGYAAELEAKRDERAEEELEDYCGA